MKAIMTAMAVLTALVGLHGQAAAQGQPLSLSGNLPEGMEIHPPATPDVSVPRPTVASPYASNGYASNGMGGYNGTGKQAGSGWRPDGLGDLIGTGNNKGHRCNPNGKGGYTCK